MFDRIKGAFETFSESKEDHKDPTLRTLSFKISVDSAKELVKKMLEDLKYGHVSCNDTFNEMFAKKAGYDVTFFFQSSRNGCDINISVFSPAHRGKTRKALRFLLNEINLRVESNGW